MSLLRLLAAGKSLVGLKQANSRYRVSGERLLPQFGCKANPFRTQGGMAQTPTATSGQHAEQSEAEEPAAKCAASPAVAIGNGQPVERIKPKLAAKQTSQRLADWAGRCAVTLASSISARPSKPRKPAIAAFAKPLVQGELSLERVKVVRNDLSDSDLDIRRPLPEPKLPPPLPEQSNPEAAEGRWSRVTSRLFGAGTR